MYICMYVYVQSSSYIPMLVSLLSALWRSLLLFYQVPGKRSAEVEESIFETLGFRDTRAHGGPDSLHVYGS